MSQYSVIIPTHRRPEWLARAVRSIRGQSFKDISIIVVSDAVCERTQQVMAELLGAGDVFVQRWGLPGPAESRNLGIQFLSSDYAMFLDDDDELPAGFIADIEAKRPKDHRGIMYSDFTIVNHHRRDDEVETATELKHSLAHNRLETIHVRNFIPNSCLVFPTKMLKARRFDPALTLNEDWDFILNVMTGASFVHVPVDGPIIHKTEQPRRGNTNNHLLLESYMSIYQKWPAPAKDLKLARQSLLAENGVSLPLSAL